MGGVKITPVFAGSAESTGGHLGTLATDAAGQLDVLGHDGDTHQALEGQLADQQLSALLVLADLTESHGTRAVSARTRITSVRIRKGNFQLL